MSTTTMIEISTDGARQMGRSSEGECNDFFQQAIPGIYSVCALYGDDAIFGSPDEAQLLETVDYCSELCRMVVDC